MTDQSETPRVVGSEDIPPGVTKILRDTQPWARFLGILGLIGVACMIAGGLAVGAAGLSARQPEMALIPFVYPITGILYFFPSMYLVRYARRIRYFVAQGHAHQLEAALEAQRSFWKSMGILTLVGLGLCLVVIGVGIGAEMAATR